MNFAISEKVSRRGSLGFAQLELLALAHRRGTKASRSAAKRHSSEMRTQSSDCNLGPGKTPTSIGLLSNLDEANADSVEAFLAFVRREQLKMKTPPQHVAQFPEVSLSNVAGKIEGIEIERPFTCEEAAELLHVHPKTLKRMAGRGELPGHFRFGRWYFYPSELDSWMREAVDSSRHSCR